MHILDASFLARLQFVFTVSFHIVFPAISIGLASFLGVLEWRWLIIGDGAYRQLFVFWSKLFAIGFGLGVVSRVARLSMSNQRKSAGGCLRDVL